MNTLYTGNLVRKGRNVMVEIKKIYENKKLDENSKIKQITDILTNNKELFKKKDFMENESLLDYINQFNTGCLPIKNEKVLHAISKKISYLQENPDLAKLIGKILNKEVEQSLPLNSGDCEDIGTHCDSDTYNRNQVICNMQKGSDIENAEYGERCTMAKSCNRPIDVPPNENHEEVNPILEQNENNEVANAFPEPNSPELSPQDLNEFKQFKEFKQSICAPELDKYNQQKKTMESMGAAQTKTITELDQTRRELEQLKNPPKKPGVLSRVFRRSGGTFKKRSTKRKHKSKSSTKKKKKKQTKRKTRSKK